MDHYEQFHDAIIYVARGGGLKYEDWKRKVYQSVERGGAERRGYKLGASHTIFVANRFPNVHMRLLI